MYQRNSQQNVLSKLLGHYKPPKHFYCMFVLNLCSCEEHLYSKRCSIILCLMMDDGGRDPVQHKIPKSPIVGQFRLDLLTIPIRKHFISSQNKSDQLEELWIDL